MGFAGNLPLPIIIEKRPAANAGWGHEKGTVTILHGSHGLCDIYTHRQSISGASEALSRMALSPAKGCSFRTGWGGSEEDYSHSIVAGGLLLMS